MTVEPEAIGFCIIEGDMDWKVLMRRKGSSIELETRGMGRKSLTIREAEHLRRSLTRFIREAKEVEEYGASGVAAKPTGEDQ